MTLRYARRAAQHVVLAFVLIGFTAVLIDTTPSLVFDENEVECEQEVEDLSMTELGTPVLRIVLTAHDTARKSVHTIRETEVLRTRNVTFRIDRPPPV